MSEAKTEKVEQTVPNLLVRNLLAGPSVRTDNLVRKVKPGTYPARGFSMLRGTIR